MSKLLLFCVLALVSACIAGCSGPGGPTIDPSGHWVPQGVSIDHESAFDIRASGGGFIVESLVSDLVPLQMTMKGNRFTMVGMEEDDSGEARTDYRVTGTITGDTMTGLFKATLVDLQSGESAVLLEQPFTAHRDA